jgi:transposase
MRQREIGVSQKELQRIHVVQLSIEGHQTVSEAAQVLGLSQRQLKRLRKKFKAGGVQGLVHGNRGKTAWNKTSKAKIEQVVGLAQGRYQGLNDSHLTEKLKEQEKLEVSRPVVRTILRRAGIAPVRKRGVKRHYQRRERRAQEGALLLWDGSQHRWFGEKQAPCNLTAVIDDATGTLLHGVFTLEEDAQSYLLCLRQILLDKGIPLALYMDRHGIFRRNDDHWSLQEQLQGEQTPTQVGQALRELGIEAIYAMTPQAKGRVERLFNTLQDRLVQELRLAGIETPPAATQFLNGSFKAEFNRRFAKPARDSQAAWRRLSRALDVDRICSFRYQATVGNDNAVRLGGMILDVPPGPAQRGYAKTRVDVRQLLDGRWRVYSQDRLLLETKAPTQPQPLRTLRRSKPKAKVETKRRIVKAMTRNDRVKSRLTHVDKAGHA